MKVPRGERQRSQHQGTRRRGTERAPRGSRSTPTEAELIGVLTREFASVDGAAHVALGIGDDAACVRFSGNLVVSVDGQIEGTHFRREWLGLDDVGYRSFQAAISDLAAMGASPVAAVAHLTLPERFSTAELRRLTRGQAEAAQATSCPVVGGNLSRGPELTVVTTVLGKATRCLSRSGARPGDELWLLGEVGLARAGLELLSASTPVRSVATRRAVSAWRRPRALLDAGRGLVGKAHACLDVSDGLARDARNLAVASGVRVEIHAEALGAALSIDLGKAARTLGVSPLWLACEGGEDYALLAAGPSRRRPAEAKVIGAVRAGDGAHWVEAGGSKPLTGGFDHFSGQ
ncbi:MAG: thiamine-phosphate kinase [Polyangiaceae bacterium]|nr:thiamine-phosphate kinase [Myxococcales bacterium]MCB9583867.1 thiamine-phosphate kinase [Polyangiaceae bacterium]MCB9607877.1 thiamine-phosphate kinase [Polyangiaceae bacterium]